MPKTQRGRKQSRYFKRDHQPDCPEDFIVESSRPKQQMWQKKNRFHDDGRLQVIVPMNMLQSPVRSYPQFYSVEGLAEWVFNAAKYRPLKLNLNFCERSEEVRDTLLRQFHRWPEVKVADAAKQFQALSQEAEQQCHEQVQLYLQELRGKLRGGSNALFWLDVLQPLTHPAAVPRPEVREVLTALLEEIKSINGIFEFLVNKSERILAVLTLPLTLEPLFQGVSGLAQCGQAAAAQEAMQILTLFADEYTARPDRKTGQMPVGVSVVASVGDLVPLGISGLTQLPQEFREQLAMPLSQMVHDWLKMVEEVLDVLEKSLSSQWISCERAPFEQELKEVVHGDLEKAFGRLSHALATNQLYAMQKVGGERLNAQEGCVNITVSRANGLLLLQLRREEL